MGRIPAFWFHRFTNWERSSQTGFLLAIMLFVVAMYAILRGSDEVRQPAMFGAMGSVIAMQAIFLWANRGMVSEYTGAQRHYLAGEFEAALTLLKEMQNHDRPDVRVLTLMGNTYRQLGLLERSEKALLEAVELNPEHPFPLYGLGRTYLALGRYEDAAQFIEAALQNGAPGVTRCDAGEAYYRLGNSENAIDLLNAALAFVQKEPQRALMVRLLLYALGEAEFPPATLIAEGIRFWQAQADLFAHTPYGAALKRDIETLQSGQGNSPI